MNVINYTFENIIVVLHPDSKSGAPFCSVIIMTKFFEVLDLKPSSEGYCQYNVIVVISINLPITVNRTRAPTSSSSSQLLFSKFFEDISLKYFSSEDGGEDFFRSLLPGFQLVERFGRFEGFAPPLLQVLSLLQILCD